MTQPSSSGSSQQPTESPPILPVTPTPTSTPEPAPAPAPTKTTDAGSGSSNNTAVIIRAVTALVAFGVGAAALIYVPDPNVKIAATGIIGAAAFAVEKMLAPN